MSEDSETSDMTLEGFGEVFEGYYADMCSGKFLLKSMGGTCAGIVFYIFYP